MNNNQAKPTEAEIRKTFMALVPYLQGLDAIDQTDCRAPDIAERMRRSGLDGLRAVSATALLPEASALPASELPHLEQHYLRVIRNEEAGRLHLGLPPSPHVLPPKAAFEQIMVIVADVQTQTKKIGAEVAAVRQQTTKPKGPLFSKAASDYHQALIAAHGTNYPELSYILHRREVFQAIVGDKHVAEIDTDDLQHFVNELQYLPQNFSKRKDYSVTDIPRYIEENKKKRARMEAAAPDEVLKDEELPGLGLNRTTLRVQYLMKIKTIVRAACVKAKIQAPDWGRVTIPKSAPRPKKRYPMGAPVLNRIFLAGVNKGILSDAMLPPLGLTVGRRLALLVYMRGEDIVQLGEHWGVIPREISFEHGKIKTTPMKTDESATVWVFNRFFVEIGFVEWARKQPGWVFEALHDRIVDPGDTASKRFSRLFLKNGAIKGLLQTFHALRGTKIEYDRLLKIDTRVIQKQVGHEFEGVHESYGAPVLTPPEIDQVANLPLPEGIDWQIFKGLDFDKMAAVRPTVGRPRRPK